MSGVITRKDIITDEALKFGETYAKNVQVAIDKNEELTASAKEMFNIYKNLGKAQNNQDFVKAKNDEALALKKATNAIKEREAALISAEKVKQASIKTEKAQIDLQNKQLTNAQRQEAALKRKTKLTAEEKRELQVLNRNAREAAIISSKLSTEYEKQSTRLVVLRRRYKDVALAEGETSKNAQRLRAEIVKLDASLKRVDANVGQFQRSVGNYGKAMGAARRAVSSLLSAMGAVGGAFLFVQVMRDAFNRVREFDKSMQNLAGVMRTSRKDLADLESEIIKVAGASVKTSREVANLAESLATLGKNKEEIKDLLEPVNNLGIALETTSEEAAEFLVQTLNAFGAGSEEASKYADVIATIRTSTTLDFQKMRDSFQYLTPISRILNKDLAYTGAVIGILADNGLKAEQAGRLLGTAQQKLAKEGKSLAEALEEVNDAQARGVKEVDLLAIASDLFGKQAAKVGVILANNSKELETNAQAIRDNGGALDDLVNEQLKSVDAQLKILDSSWEELILTIENGQGSISQTFTQFIGFLTTLIQRTTDLEVAQSRVFEITGKQQDGFFKRMMRGALTLGLVKTEFEELTEIQERFEKTNENIDANGILTLQSMYDGLNDEIANRNDLSEEEYKLYQRQKEVISEAIKRKQDERKSLEDTAIALGFNEKELGKYADSIELYTNGDLKAFIQANQEAKDAVNELSDAEKAAAEKERQKKADQQKEDKNNLAKSQLEANIEANKAILEDEKSTLLQKQIANLNYSQQRQALLELERDIAIEANKGRTDKLEQIETEYTAKLTAIDEERQANVLKFIEEDFNIRKKSIDEARQAKEDALNAEIALEQEKLQATEQNPEDVETYEKAVLAIRKKYALETIQVQIDAVQKLLDVEGLTVDQRAELQRQLSILKQSYSDVETDHIIDNNKKQLEAEKELQELKQQIISDSSTALAETLNIDAENLNVLITNIAEGFENGMQDVLTSISAVAGITGDIMNGVYEANIESLENQLEASENYYNRQFELAEGDARQQDLIRTEQEQKRVELENKIKKEKIKQAKANKAAAIIQAGINTALAVTSALTFAPPASFVMAALAAALGIAQIAIIAAKPIPQYAKGTEYHPGGLAEVAEVRPEVIHEPNKKPYIQRKRAVLNLAEGTKVYSSVEDFNRQMRYAAIMSSIQSQKQNLNDYETALSFDAYSSDVVNELRLTRKAIRESKSNINVVQNKIDLDQELFRFKNLNR